MHCPFCRHKMYSMDNGAPPPRLSMVWICHRCPQEVRVQSEKDIEEEQHWLMKTLSIFVDHKGKKYVLLWDYRRKQFYILDANSTTGSPAIVQMEEMPSGVTPNNALNKLKIYLTFQ